MRKKGNEKLYKETNYFFPKGTWTYTYEEPDEDINAFTGTFYLNLLEEGGGEHSGAIEVFADNENQINALLNFLNSPAFQGVE